jgi:hypothetical protein
VANFWVPGLTVKSARSLGNPNKHAGIGKKNPTGDPVGFLIWWWGGTPPPTVSEEAIMGMYCPELLGPVLNGSACASLVVSRPIAPSRTVVDFRKNTRKHAEIWVVPHPTPNNY